MENVHEFSITNMMYRPRLVDSDIEPRLYLAETPVSSKKFFFVPFWSFSWYSSINDVKVSFVLSFFNL